MVCRDAWNCTFADCDVGTASFDFIYFWNFDFVDGYPDNCQEHNSVFDFYNEALQFFRWRRLLTKTRTPESSCIGHLRFFDG